MKINLNLCLRTIFVILSVCLYGCESSRCETARTKCAYRKGCGLSLHGYMVDCADLIAGRTNKCEPSCLRALITLISTDEGQELMNCDCEANKFCEHNKQRIQVCRPSVLSAMADDSPVSCTTARWICMADPLCSTAMDYYHRFCRSMFDGRRCTARCNNSLSILDRQEKATKLRTCYCEGTEDFPCQRIQDNTNRLCFGSKDSAYSVEQILDNSVDRATDHDSAVTCSVRTLTASIVLCVVVWSRAVTLW